jgi:hypothetical protein
MLELGIAEAMLQLAVVGEQQQPFTVSIKAAYRIHVFDCYVPPKRVAFAGELAKYAEGFVKQDVAHSPDYPTWNSTAEGRGVKLKFWKAGRGQRFPAALRELPLPAYPTAQPQGHVSDDERQEL